MGWDGMGLGLGWIGVSACRNELVGHLICSSGLVVGFQVVTSRVLALVRILDV